MSFSTFLANGLFSSLLLVGLTVEHLGLQVSSFSNPRCLIYPHQPLSARSTFHFYDKNKNNPQSTNRKSPWTLPVVSASASLFSLASSSDFSENYNHNTWEEEEHQHSLPKIPYNITMNQETSGYNHSNNSTATAMIDSSTGEFLNNNDDRNNQNNECITDPQRTTTTAQEDSEICEGEADLQSEMAARDSSLQQVSVALKNFLETVNSINNNNTAHGEAPSAFLVADDKDFQPPPPNNLAKNLFASVVKHINSLVFQVQKQGYDENDNGDNELNDRQYILAVLSSDDRVDTAALEYQASRVLYGHDVDNTQNNKKLKLTLARSFQVASLCGFEPGCIPPLALTPPPILTLVESSLQFSEDERIMDHSQIYLEGGGGLPHQSLYISLSSLFLFHNNKQSSSSSSQSSCNTLTVAEFRQEKSFESRRQMIFPTSPTVSTVASQIAATTTQPHYPPGPNPFFAVEPPPDEVIHAALKDDGSSNRREKDPSLQPVAFTVVGRVARVRRMAKRLVFCDLVPPSYSSAATADYMNQNAEQTAIDDTFYPWRSARDGQDMAVQMIAGKTLCQKQGEEAVAKLSKSVGALVMVEAKTNVGNRESLQNWMKKKSLDIVVFSYQILQEERDGAMTSSLFSSDDPQKGDQKQYNDQQIEAVVKRSRPIKHAYFQAAPPTVNGGSTNQQQPYANGKTVRETGGGRAASWPRPPAQEVPGMSYLSVHELYGLQDDNDNVPGMSDLDPDINPHVTVVDDLDSVLKFSKEISLLLMSLSTDNSEPAAAEMGAVDDEGSPTSSIVGLVGIDCEWRPSFLSKSKYDPQPVLLMQICLHPLKQVYLLDLQSLLRPLREPSEPMNDVEVAVSAVMSDLLTSRKLIKVGFQLVQDLRRLAASYPHISSFQLVDSVLEASRLAKKVMRLTKQRNSRRATESLNKLTQHFLSRTINKDQQCSDWAMRPLTPEQIEYAALDAVITPVIVEKLIELSDARFFSKPQMGRWKDDKSFTDTLTSWRFLFLDKAEDLSPIVIRKLNAKRIIGNPFIVTQNWITGNEPLQLPSLPTSEKEGSFVDAKGVLRVPSTITSIRTSDFLGILESIIGSRVGRSKDQCIEVFMKGEAKLPEGGRIDFPQRSGFVEFSDAVFLFVNMPETQGTRQPRSYPNEILEEGQIMTWFIRESDWEQGTTKLAKKLLPCQETGEVPLVILFVRIGKGHFLCCGRCRVTTFPNNNVDSSGRNWELVKLYLMLQDWNRLMQCRGYAKLVNPDSFPSDDDSDNDTSSDDMSTGWPD